MLDYLVAALLLAGVSRGIAIDERWQPEDSPVAALFKRAAPSPNDPNFQSNYPGGGSTPPSSMTPKAWSDKLATLQLPNFGPSQPNNGYPTYSGGLSGADPTVCSFTYQCSDASDLVDAPNGTLALAFDDGPSGGSDVLYAYLAQNNIASKATHFMIGGNILYNPNQMLTAVNAGGHIAVHTWSHPYMTPLTNDQVLAELGWTMQIISDLNGGRIPKYWRPPYGDVDNRVRAIAKGVFGLTTVPWREDSGDWAITHDTRYTNDSVNAAMNGWLTGPKSPGLNILEHELNGNTVGIFMTNYPKMVSNGWNVQNVADAWGGVWYQNAAKGNTGSMTPMNITGGGSNLAVNGTSSSSSMVSSTSSAASSTSASSSKPSTSASATSASSAAAAAATTSKSAASPAAAMPNWISAVAALVALLL